MNEQLCFVQFLHPGGEHGVDVPGLKHWNRDLHKRKFIRGRGQMIDDEGRPQDAELVLWGEWEPPSRVHAIDQPLSDGPRFLHDPFLPSQAPQEWRQNTDPFVFGDTFHYTGCLQHTKFGPTQLRYLSRGSVILFGSCVGRSQFALDTVLVVDRYLDHSRGNVEDARHAVSPVYAAATLDPWYSESVPPDRSFRLYFGATFDKPVEEMFSFAPALPANEAPRGFARPTIDLPEAITPTMAQGKRLNKQSDAKHVRRLWACVVAQVRDQGLALGAHVELPPVESGAGAGKLTSHRGC